jgi:hypothetical protein
VPSCKLPSAHDDPRNGITGLQLDPRDICIH